MLTREYRPRLQADGGAERGGAGREAHPAGYECGESGDVLHRVVCVLVRARSSISQTRPGDRILAAASIYHVLCSEFLCIQCILVSFFLHTERGWCHRLAGNAGGMAIAADQ
jgi:hypothetical protein